MTPFAAAVNSMCVTPAVLMGYIERSYKEHTIRVNGTECLVIIAPDADFVIPRGTADLDDVIRDVRTLPWPSKRLGGWSHAGFFKGARGLVDKGLIGVLDKTKITHFLGHSLGGALALNCAAILHAEGFNIGSVVTIGAPRTFTRGTAKKIRKLGFPITEFSNHGDPVPHVPFRWWRYRHCSEVMTLRKRDGRTATKNHLLPFYREAFGCG